ncbi:MAG TPA: NF038130 family PEP-CTERM protein [Coleofasciculaceae cyanobacterium]
MKGIIRNLLLGASVVAGVGGLSNHAALAGSITGATLGGTAPYILYDATSTYTFANPSASLSTILTGDSSNPTGNVELFSNSEQSPLSTSNPLQAFTALNNFLGYNKVTTLSGEIGGKSITLSSLTAADWFATQTITTVSQAISSALSLSNPVARASALNAAVNPLYNTSNLATQWFNTTLSTYGVSSSQTLFNTFLLAGGFQRFSDPNISYVNQDADGTIRIGLAGHYDAAPLLGLPSNPAQPLQASELVKVSYDNGTPQYLRSFKATESLLYNREEFLSNGKKTSHSGNYEVSFQGTPPASVPEPSVVLGLLTVGGLVASKRKFQKV